MSGSFPLDKDNAPQRGSEQLSVQIQQPTLFPSSRGAAKPWHASSELARRNLLLGNTSWFLLIQLCFSRSPLAKCGKIVSQLKKTNTPALYGVYQSLVAPQREMWYLEQTSEQVEAKHTLINNTAG